MSLSQSHPSRIVLPTDFERPARRAFYYGLALAQALGTRVEILHVIKTATDASGPPPDTPYLRSLRTSALLELGRLTRIAKEAGIQAEPRLDFGVPDDRILHHMAQPQAKCLVLGTEGRTGWDRLRLGSTALKVIRQATCPVLAVHGGLAGDVVRHAARVRFDRILLATDFSRCAQEALGAVALLVRLTDAKVRVLHVTTTREGKRRGRRNLDQVIRRLRGQGMDADGAWQSGDPVEMILEEAGRWEADLVATGTQGRRGLSRLMLGSVAEGILRRAGCPVLVVKTAAPLLRAIGRGGRRRESR